MCNCTGNSCGCTTVTGRRGGRGEQGIPGVAGAAGENAQALFGDGPPTTTYASGPTPPTAAADYADTSLGGHWWQWNAGAWTDTGAPVSGTDGVNAFTTVTSAFPIPGELGFYAVYVGDSTWMVDPGQVLAVEGGGASGGVGYYKVFGYISNIQVILQNMKDTPNSAYLDNLTTGTILAGAKVSPAGIQGPAGIPVEFTSGALDPTVAPVGGASGAYIQSGAGGTFWYYNGPSGPWTDTGIGVTGPAGANGANGANGTNGTNGATGATGPAGPTGPPGSGGAPVDAEYIVAVSNATLSNERVANATPTVVPDSSTPGIMKWNVPDDGITNNKLNNVPSNTFKGLGLGGPANPIDLTANQASTILDTATDPFVRTSAIPGGTSTFQSISDGSPVLGDGRQTGTNVWTMQRSIQYTPRTLTIVSPLTTNLDTDYQWQRISINVVSFTLGWTGLGIDQNCEWIFEFTNDYIDAGSGLPAQTHLTYDSGRWTKNQGVTQPSYINPGEVVTLHCFQRDGKMNITCVEQGVTAI